MKKFSVAACAALVLSLVIAIGSASFLGPCVHEDGSFGACHWAGRMMTGLGGLLAVLSLLAIVLPGRLRAGLFLAMVPTAALGLLAPGRLISLCGMATMRCRAVMQPSMTVLCALVLVVSGVGCALEFRKTK